MRTIFPPSLYSVAIHATYYGTLQTSLVRTHNLSKLNGCKEPHQAYNPVGIHQMVPPEHTSNKQAYYSFIDPRRMKG